MRFWGSRRTLLGVAVAIAAVLAGDAAALVAGQGEVDAATLLARTTAFVRHNRSVHFEGGVRLEERLGRRRDVGSFSVTRLALEGDAHFSGRAHFTIDYGDNHAELIVLGLRVWSRQAERLGRLDDQKWSRADPGAEDRRSGVVRPGRRADGDPGQPQQLLRLLELGRRPHRVHRPGDGTTFAVELDPGKAFGAFGEDVDEATLEVTVDDDGRTPLRAVLRVLGREADLAVDYRLSSWGERVAITAPALADVDPTPGIDEEEVAAFDEVPLLQPRGIPAGWELDVAAVVEGEGAECDRVDLDYIDPASDRTGYLYLHQMAVACRTDPDEGWQPFAAGRYLGYFLLDDGQLSAELVAGETLLQVETDLSPDELATVLAHLRPLDLTVAPEPLSGVGRKRAGA